MPNLFPGSGRLTPPALLLLRMSHILYRGLQGPPQPHREANAALASTLGRILLRRLKDGAGVIEMVF